MLSVRNMLDKSSQNHKSKPYNKPSALDISFILCPPESEHPQSVDQKNNSDCNSEKSIKEENCISLPWEQEEGEKEEVEQQQSTTLASTSQPNSYSIKVSHPPFPSLSESISTTSSSSNSISLSSMIRDESQFHRNRENQFGQRHMEPRKIERELLYDRRNSTSSCSSSFSFSSSRNASDEDEYLNVGSGGSNGGGGGSLKAKRRRASSKQLEVLNKVFERTFFPSTQLRAELGRQLGMNPRTVQIWFQNRRQAIRTKERSKDKSHSQNRTFSE